MKDESMPNLPNGQHIFTAEISQWGWYDIQVRACWVLLDEDNMAFSEIAIWDKKHKIWLPLLKTETNEAVRRILNAAAREEVPEIWASHTRRK